MITGISINKRLLITPLLMLTLLAVFSFTVNDFHLSTTVSYGAFAVFAFLFTALSRGKLYLSKTQVAAAMLAAVATVMVFLPYARTDVDTVSTVMSLDIAMLYIIICHPDENDAGRTLRMLLLAAVLISAYAVAISVYPNLYYAFVKRILPSDTQARIELGLQENYGISIGGQCLVADYYAFFGVVISLNTLLIKKENAKERTRYIATFVICALAIIVQNRKAELITTLCVVMFLFLSNVNVTSLKQKLKQILVFLAVAVFGIAVFELLLRKGYLPRYEIFFAQMKMKFFGGGSTVDVTSGREMLWGRAVLLFKEHPVFGIGWGNFRNHLTDTYSEINDGQLNTAHNNYLQLLCETGIVGLVLFAGPLFYIFSRTFKAIKYLRVHMSENTTARIAVATSLSFQMFYLAISFIDPVWHMLFTWPFYGVSVILMIYAESCSDSLKRL